MNEEREYEQTQDDLDVEIIDMPGLQSDSGTRSKSAVASALKPRFSLRQRSLQLIMTASVVMLVILVVLGSSLPVRNLAARVFAGPPSIPAASLAPGVDLFYINGQPPWGQAYLDGHVLAHIPAIGVDQPLHLSRGRHFLQWRAAPFQWQRCTVSVPPNLSIDTCNLNASVQLKSGLSASIITFSAALTTLPASLRSGLVHAAQAALDAQQSTETVLPGELYNHLAQNSIVGITRQPLRATLHFQLDTDPTSDTPCLINESGQGCVLLEQDCHIFCPNPAATSTSLEWDVLAKIFPAWNYTTLAGSTIAQNQPDASGGAEGGEYLVPLSIIWESGSEKWQVTALFDDLTAKAFADPTCGSAEDEVQIDPSLKNAAINNSPAYWQFASGSVYAAGCVAVATPLPDNTSTSTSSPHLLAICLHRFGLFLAVNDLAHHLWPFMPMADAYEQNLARHLIVSSGITAG